MHELGPNFSTREAQRQGMSRSRLRRADLLAPHHGVRATVPAEDLVGRCRALLPAMTPWMLFSHETAAGLHGLPLPRDSAVHATLHVSTRAPRRAIRHRGVTGHQTRLGEKDVTALRGLPVVGAVEAWCELASTLRERDLVVCGDALLRRKGPLATMEDLAAAVEAAPGRPGIRRLRAALSQVRARTDSPMETVLRLALVSAGMPEPMVNYQILGRDGGVAAHGDLVYPESRLVVEYDGEHHRTDAHQYHVDIDRLWRIRSLGWEIVRLNKSHLRGDASEAVRRVRLALASS